MKFNKNTREYGHGQPHGLPSGPAQAFRRLKEGFSGWFAVFGPFDADNGLGAGPVLNESCIHKVVAIFYNDVYYALSEKSEEQEQRLRLQTAASNTLEGG